MLAMNANTVPKIEIVPTEPWHIGELRGSLQAADAAEILRFGISIKEAAWGTYRKSVIRKTALIDGKVAACWGASGTLLGNNGVPWLLTSVEVTRISPLKFVTIYQQEVYAMLKRFHRLENYVDARHEAAIRVLDIIGFTVEEPVSYGFFHEQYRKFWIGRA